eukprot:scaffold297530_cov15-Tisochrysis_lutea.AAC.1
MHSLQAQTGQERKRKASGNRHASWPCLRNLNNKPPGAHAFAAGICTAALQCFEKQWSMHTMRRA